MKKILKVSFLSLLLFTTCTPRIHHLGKIRVLKEYRPKEEDQRSQKAPLIGMIVLLVALLVASTFARNKR